MSTALWSRSKIRTYVGRSATTSIVNRLSTCRTARTAASFRRHCPCPSTRLCCRTSTPSRICWPSTTRTSSTGPRVINSCQARVGRRVAMASGSIHRAIRPSGRSSATTSCRMSAQSSRRNSRRPASMPPGHSHPTRTTAFKRPTISFQFMATVAASRIRTTHSTCIRRRILPCLERIKRTSRVGATPTTTKSRPTCT